jgi:hypothetical protein
MRGGRSSSGAEGAAPGATIQSCLPRDHVATDLASAGASREHQIPSYWNGLAPHDSFDALNAAGHYPGPMYGCPAADTSAYTRGQSHGAAAEPSEATAPVKRALSMARCTPQSAPAQVYGKSPDAVPAEAQSLTCVQHPGHLPGIDYGTENLVLVDPSACALQGILSLEYMPCASCDA